MRSLLVTVSVCLWVGAVVLAAGWALQVSALPRPERSDLAALRAMTKLQRYRFVESSIRIGGGPVVRGRCLEGWYPAPKRTAARGALLRLSDRGSVLDLGRLGLTIEGRLRRGTSGEAVADLLLAGCSHELAPNVEALIQNGTPTHSERAWFGRPALAVRFTLRPATSMTLYLAPKTDAVLGLAVRFPHVHGWSRIRPLPLTPARLALFEGR